MCSPDASVALSGGSTNDNVTVRQYTVTFDPSAGHRGRAAATDVAPLPPARFCANDDRHRHDGLLVARLRTCSARRSTRPLRR